MDFNNPANWQLMTDQSLDSPLQLPGFTIAGFDSAIVGVQTSSATSRATWRLGGWCSQILQLPDNSFTNLETWRSPFWLNRNTILAFPYDSLTYDLRVEFPYWLRAIDIRVWRYTGG